MNTNTNIVLRATKRTEESVTEIMNNLFKDQKYIANLNDLFATALVHADYEVSNEAIQMFDVGNGTGYYDPLIRAVFLDAAGQPITAFSSVALFDVKTKRRLYLVVMSKGQNIIVHDHKTPANENEVRLAKTGGAESRIINMDPVWSSDVAADFVNAANLFGFELYRRMGDNEVRVYVPKWKTQNWFQRMASFLNVSLRREVQELAETDVE